MDDYDDKEELKEVLDKSSEEHSQISTVETLPRKKRLARFYYGGISLCMLLLLLLCVIGLGSFGDFQRKLSKLYEPGFNGKHQWCILFAHTEPYSDPKDEKVTWKIYYRSFSPCIFTFWALVSGTIFAFALLVYYIVQWILGSVILSILRILDFIIFSVGFLFFLSFTITITAGLSQACYGPVAGRGHSCAGAYLVNEDRKQLYFYSAVSAARNCSWIVTMLLLCFSIWNLFLMVMFIRKKGKKSEVERNKDLM